jgi:hypothetical protein
MFIFFAFELGLSKPFVNLVLLWMYSAISSHFGLIYGVKLYLYYNSYVYISDSGNDEKIDFIILDDCVVISSAECTA